MIKRLIFVIVGNIIEIISLYLEQQWFIQMENKLNNKNKRVFLCLASVRSTTKQ